MTEPENQTETEEPADVEQPLVSHLVELRDRLIRALIGIGVVFAVLMPFANRLFTALAGPLTAVLPEDSKLIAIEVASPFLIPFKLALVMAIFIAMPWVLYQIWAFVAPGLYRHERRLVLPLVVSSTFLFFAGAAFAYFVVFPLIFAFFTSTAPEGVSVMTDIGRYLDFVLTIFFAFGLAFQIPVVTFVMVWMGATTPEALAAKRPYVIVGVFVIGMLLTPPDVISQSLLAIPMWLLFELGILFSRLLLKKPAAGEAEADLSDEEMEAELERAAREEEAHDSPPK